MIYDLQSDQSVPGNALRDQASNYLAELYGPGRVECLRKGKKADAIFTETHLGKKNAIILESKDYKSPLTRDQVNRIWSDYYGLVDKLAPAVLLLVTRNGLGPAAQSFVHDELDLVRHLTIWELEDQVLGLTPYLRSVAGTFEEEGLSHFYVPSRAHLVSYDQRGSPTTSGSSFDLTDRILRWIDTPAAEPIAILGGYGAGKTSFASRLASLQAQKALKDPTARRPIVIRLGQFTRYSNLDGIVGALFTSRFAVPGYSFHRFMSFNEQGRFLIVLDGFDEMKHAMSWSEFKNQLAELNQLIRGQAKVLLLGRPTAFTSDEEHHWVLRGQRKLDDAWHRIPNWPEFIEFRLDGFTPEERRSFITRFLEFHELKRAALEKKHPDLAWVSKRAEEVRSIADNDPDVFTKPVHSKILTELAVDPNLSLDRFKDGLSRWTLYEEFYRYLAAREGAKEARRDLSDRARLAFMRELAFWLWTSRNKATDFQPESLPDELFSDIQRAHPSEMEDLRRELLSGSFLETKAAGVYYFPHRSFAEFLVADYIVRDGPKLANHIRNSSLFRDGVAEFLRSYPPSDRFLSWGETMSHARAKLDLGYLEFLARVSGGGKKLRRNVHVSSGWYYPLGLLDSSFDLGVEHLRAIRQALLTSHEAGFVLSLRTICLQRRKAKLTSPQKATLSTYILSLLLDRLFENTKVEPYGLVNNTTSGDFARRFANACAVRGGTKSDYFEFYWGELEKAVIDWLSDTEWGLSDHSYTIDDMPTVDPVMKISIKSMFKHVPVEKQSHMRNCLTRVSRNVAISFVSEQRVGPYRRR